MIVKYGIIFDRKILEIISSSIDYNKDDRLLSLIKSDVFENVIYRCCSIKSRVVEKDEFDLGYRNLLNFGHTIGHCIENASDLKNINHGQAVGMGMIVAIDISISLGLAKVQLKDNILKLYKRLKLPYIIPRLSIEKIMSALKYDKKFTSKKNKFVLLNIGGRLGWWLVCDLIFTKIPFAPTGPGKDKLFAVFVPLLCFRKGLHYFVIAHS